MADGPKLVLGSADPPPIDHTLHPAMNGVPGVLLPTPSGASCDRCPVQKLSVCWHLSQKDAQRLFPFGARVQVRQAGATLFHQGEAFDYVLIVRSGWVAIYKVFEEGQRQIIRFALPGDLVGFEGNAAAGMAYGAEAITNVTLCGIKRSLFFRVCNGSPQLAMNFASTLAREALSAWNHVGALGQQGALGRVANLLLDLHRRVAGHDREDGGAVHLPISQIHIGDATGLTSVHVCRTLKQMRQDGLLDFRKERLVLLDPQRLAEIAQLDPEVSFEDPVPTVAVV